MDEWALAQLKTGFVAMQAKKVILRQQEKQCEAHRECLPQHLPASWQERLVSEPWRPNPVMAAAREEPLAPKRSRVLEKTHIKFGWIEEIS